MSIETFFEFHKLLNLIQIGRSPVMNLPRITIILASFIGAPAYLNGYAAVPLVDALITHGISTAAALSFMIAGGVSSIPAALAVWALVKPRVFAAYLGLAVTGAVISGMVWQMIA